MAARPDQRQPSHFHSGGRIERLVIPIHGGQDIKAGLQRSLMKLIPLDEEEL
jgi:hypothetical protein